MTTILAVIFVLGVLIFVHELGHFLAARSVGVRVRRFSLGFPPRLISFTPTAGGWRLRLFFYRKDGSGKLSWLPVVEKIISGPLSRATETEYCVALVPFGGYVKMAGAIDETLDADLTGAPDELNSKNRLQQAWVLSAGVLMNLALSVIVFAGLTLHNGIAEVTNEPTVMELEPGFPAEKAGIRVGDRVLSIDGKSISTWEEMTDIIHARSEEIIFIEWQRGEELFSAEILTREGHVVYEGVPKLVGLIGVRGGYRVRSAGLLESVMVGAVQTTYWLDVIVKSIEMIATGKASAKDIGGPILIAQLAGQSAQAGFAVLLSFMAIISVNLAFINILPIPGLDGGHLLIILIECVVRREISLKVRTIIQQVGMAFLMLLILFVLFNDISRLFSH